MSGQQAAEYEQHILTEVIAGLLGFDTLAESVFDNSEYSIYLLVLTGIFLDFVVLDLYNYFIADTITIVNDPLGILVPISLLFGVFGIKYMRTGYADAVTKLRLQDRPDITDHDLFTNLLSLRARVGVYAGFLVIYYFNLVFLYGLDAVIAVEGLVTAVLTQFLIIPLVSIPVVLDLGMMFISIHFILPKRLVDADPELFFYDPRDMGGFAPIGDLLKKSYYIYTGGLLLAFLLIYGQIILSAVVDSPYPPPNRSFAVFFSIAWIVGVASIGNSMYRTHQLMGEKKQQQIRNLEEELLDVIDNPYDPPASGIADPEGYEQLQMQLDEVRATREYPTTFTMWSQIAISVLLPQALNMAMQAFG